MTPHDPITLVTFRDEFVADFDRLNREWLVQGNFLEPADEAYLAAPRALIIDVGGEIFFALRGSDVVGTAAAIPHAGNVIELAKLAVAPDARGRGLGRALTDAVIAFARSRHAARVVLTSNTRLTAAVSLYRSLGFEARECPPGFGYETADLYMELAL
ncbi:MAG: GNAT family N-acetyltransferase [Gemmatimonadaceae bacterium]|nr:GNAT family N-acetyltransferase [Gemmatimonadaceae bacterium]